MTVSAGDAHEFAIYGGRLRVAFPILDADGDLVTGAAGLDSERSIDFGTFADCTNEATEIATSSGVYFLDLTATETTGKSVQVIVKTSTSGAKTTTLSIPIKRMPVLRSGTAQAGASGTITLDSGASAKDGAYVGCFVQCSNNTPSNVQGQTRKIVSYVGSTKVATVESNWGTNPSSSTTFDILVPETVNVEGWLGKEVADTDTNGHPKVTHKSGTGAGELNISSGVVDSNVVNWKGSTAPAMTGDAYARLGAPAGASVSADIATVAGYVDTEVAAIKAKTDQLTFTVANQVDVNVVDWKGSAAPAMTGDAYARLGAPAGASVSADIATVASYIDTEVAAIKAKTDNLPSDPADASDIAGAFSTVNSTLATIAGYIDTEVAAIKAKTDNLPASPAATSDIPTAAAIADAVWDEATSGHGTAGSTGAALTSASAPSAADVADAVWDEVLSGHAGVGSAGAAVAAAGSSGDPWSTPLPGAYGAGTAGQIIGDMLDAAVSSVAASVWEEPIASHSGTTGSTAEQLAAAGAAGDPWATPIPGSYGVGTAGKILGDRIDAAISTRASQSSVDTVAGYVDTEVAAIKAKTDNLPSDPADASDIAGAFSTVNSTLATIAGYVDTEVAAIKAKTDQLTFTVANQVDVNVVDWKGATAPAMTGDAYARLGAPAGASVSADIAAVAGYVDTEVAAIKTKTDQLTFTVANQVDVNVVDWKGATAPAMTGDAYARLGAPAGASVSADIAAVAGYVDTEVAAIKTKTDQLTFTVANQVDVNVVDWKGAAAPAMTGDAYARLGAPSGASVSADIATVAGYIDTEVAAIKAKTDNLPSSPAAVSDIPTANQNADALLDRTAGVETNRTLRQALRLMLAALAGKASGLATTTATFRDTNDTKDRIVATVDADGNRSAVTLDAS